MTDNIPVIGTFLVTYLPDATQPTRTHTQQLTGKREMRRRCGIAYSSMPPSHITKDTPNEKRDMYYTRASMSLITTMILS
jgi:hypothetical protein